MKSVLRSAKPYWIYLILTGKKTIEVGKDFPKNKDWNKVVEMYCSKDMRSFNRIPEKDREWMRKYLGKVACRFVCDMVEEFHEWQLSPQGKFQEYEENDLKRFLLESCLSWVEVYTYRQNLPYHKPLYAWHISELKIYDAPKELGEFRKPCGDSYDPMYGNYCGYCDNRCKLTRPPQSWCYVEGL